MGGMTNDARMSDSKADLKLFYVSYGGSGIHVNVYALDSLQELLVLLGLDGSPILQSGTDLQGNNQLHYDGCTITEVALRWGEIFSVIE